MSQAQNVQVKSEIRLKGDSSAMKSPILWIGALALLIVAILVFGTVSANQDFDFPSSDAGRSVNPELSAAQRYAELDRRSLERENLAVNPELKVVLDRPAAVRADSTTVDRAINPEVYFAQRYAESASIVRERETIWDANPELSAANRFAETSTADVEGADLYQNPELKLTMGQTTTGAYDDDFLRANPEFKAHRRFAAEIGN
jgi:hypothetical protein